MRPKVFVTRRIAKEALDLIEKECDLEVFPHNRVIKKKELLKKVKKQEGLLVLVTDPIDKEVIEAGKNLKVIANYGEGYSHIDVEAAASRGILVTNTPSDDIATAVAEATWGLILAVVKRITEGDFDVRSGFFRGWAPGDYIGVDISGKTLGIVGLGRIGKKVAQRAQGWDIALLYVDEVGAGPEIEKSLKIKRVSLETLLQESDIITLHVPLIPGKTFHLIGKKELSLMKPLAYLVNTSRGAVIDEKALVKVLKKRHIAGAALDVYEQEPCLTKGLAKLNNVVLTPHLAGATPRARVRPAILAAKNLLAGIRGEIPPNLVNKA